MFIVRQKEEDAPTDFKCFVRKEDARRHFLRAKKRAREQEIEGAALFYVDGTDDPREALRRLQVGKATPLVIEPEPIPEEVNEAVRKILAEVLGNANGT